VLLLTVPLLLAWASSHAGDARRRRLARAGLGAVLAALWLGALSPYIGPADELASWALAGVLVALLAASAPPLPGRRAGRSPAVEQEEAV
jgi:hypothetical protein